jgi:hypothetical protein
MQMQDLFSKKFTGKKEFFPVDEKEKFPILRLATSALRKKTT